MAARCGVSMLVDADLVSQMKLLHWLLLLGSVRLVLICLLIIIFSFLFFADIFHNAHIRCSPTL